jgi:ABC-type Fe3+ transport system substrate-binding protein
MDQGTGMSRRAFLASSAALIAASGLAACSPNENSESSAYRTATTIGNQQDLLNAAKKEGTLTAYLAMAQEPFTDWARGFTNKHGISVLAQMQGNNALFSRWAQETHAGKNIADFVIFGGEDLLHQAKKNGWIAKYTPTNDSKYVQGVSKESGDWYGLYLAIEPLVFNSGQVLKEEAASLLSKNYEALFDKSWVGRTSTVVPAASNRVYATYYRLVQEHGWSFLEQLAATKPTFQDTGTSAMNQVGAGQSAVLIAGGEDSLAARAVASGAPVEFAYPETSTATMEFGAISSNAPHAAAVRLFMEWATSDEGLTSLAAITQGTPCRAGIPDSRPAAVQSWYKPPTKLDLNWSIDPQESAAQTAFLAQWAKVFNYSI